MNISLLSVGALLAAGLLGVVMGLNRTFKTRDKESLFLQAVATVAGARLIAFSVYSMLRSAEPSATPDTYSRSC